MKPWSNCQGLAAFLAAILIVLTLFRLSVLEKRVVTLSRVEGKLSRLDGKVDALLKHAGIAYDPYENLPDDVIRAVQQGEKIQAIKHYRAETGVGLREAKEFIEEVQRRMGIGT